MRALQAGFCLSVALIYSGMFSSKSACAEVKQPPEQTATAQADKKQEQDINFGPFMADLQRRIKRYWFPPTGNETKRVVTVFKIHKDGSLSHLKIERTSGSPFADHAALEAVRNATPFRVLPDGSPPEIDIQFTFDYNVFRAGNPTALRTRIAQLQNQKGKEKDLEETYLSLGMALAAKGEAEEARQAFEKAVVLSRQIFGAQSDRTINAVIAEVKNLYTATRKFQEGLAVLNKTDGEISASNISGKAALKVARAELIEMPQSHWTEAETLFRDALSLMKTSGSPAKYDEYLLKYADCNVRANRTRRYRFTPRATDYSAGAPKARQIVRESTGYSAGAPTAPQIGAWVD